MIGPLRARHRVIATRLALVLPALFALALATRSPEPERTALPGAAGEIPPIAMPLRQHVQMHLGRVYTASFGADPRVVALVHSGGESAPDVLAYWSAREPRDGELPADALLLGAVSDRERRFRLPDAAGDQGWIVLFSLGHGEMVASIALAAE